MSTKHTPGPWEVEREVDPHAEDGDVAFVTKIGPFSIEWHDSLNKNAADRVEADIALASSVTELLEALSELETVAESSLDYRPEFRRALSRAHSAIAKATGSQA